VIKKILLVGLWTVALSLCSSLIAVVLCVAFSRAVFHGAAVTEHVRRNMESIWTYAPQIAAPIALLAGIFGLLPGTRLQRNAPSPSEWARWCYRFSVMVVLFAMVVSMRWDSTLWNVLGTTPIIFALGVALIDKYTQKHRPPAPGCS
jgi:hypothetical protein